jgi:hypothetical protein
MFQDQFKINKLFDIRSSSEEYLKYYNKMYPSGSNAGVRDNIRFISAFSVNGFLGIQNPAKSSFASSSMVKTLNSHYNSVSGGRCDVLLDYMSPIFTHVRDYPEVMESPYHTLLQSSRQSSSSIIGDKRKYRDFIFDNSLRDIIDSVKSGGVNYVLVSGTRSDRRGKYRLICSNEARIRVFDHILNNGSYEIFDAHHGVMKNYSCEGLSISDSYPKMRLMVTRGNLISACTDYEGYDSQFGPNDYARITYELNRHRFNHPIISEILPIFND